MVYCEYNEVDNVNLQHLFSSDTEQAPMKVYPAKEDNTTMRSRMGPKNPVYRDISGMRFGKLTAVEKTDLRDYKRSVIWKCICSCGKECMFSEDALVHHKNSSCGCDWVNGKKYNNLDRVLHRTEGTCLERLCITKARVDSKTGYVGITLTANGQYRATIGFKGKRYYLGTYYHLEEALAARKRGEKMHEDFLKKKTHELEKET